MTILSTDFQPAVTDRALSSTPDPTGFGARYDMLDCWRGLAALGVVLFHMGVFPGGNEAVMLFFVISGYCITAASESGLQRKMPFKSFMWRRARRIYPPYLFALGFFVITRVVKVMLTGDGFPKIDALQWVQNVTLTQWLSLPGAWPTQAPNNPVNVVAAFWSLQYEEQFYLIVAGMMCAGLAAARWVTISLMAVSAAVVLTVAHRGATGFFVDYWLYFGFGAIVFYRLCRWPKGRTRLIVDVLLLAAAVACGALAMSHGATDGRQVWRELTVVLTFAVVLIHLRPFDAVFTRTWVGRALMPLGLISYSLYLVHQLNLNSAAYVAAHVWRGGPAWALTVIQVVFHLFIATLFWYLCERPFLNHRPTVISPERRKVTDSVETDLAAAMP